MFALTVAIALLPGAFAQDAPETWTLLSDFEGVQRMWTNESGPTDSVRVSETEAFAGRRSLAVTLNLNAQPPMVRATWQTDIGDLRLAPDSRLRFRLKGSDLAQLPHGGIILIESNGKTGGGDSHWILGIPGETYSDAAWHEFVSQPLSEAGNPEWAPDVDGKLDPSRISRLLFVAQEEAPPDLLKPFTVYLDDVEVSHAVAQEPSYTDAAIEARPDHVTPVWRGFKGRTREHPATVTFGDLAGWRVAHPEGDTGRLLRSEEEPCYEDLRYQAKLVYASPSGAGRYELLPPQPLPLPDDWNAVSMWVFGNNWSWVPKPDTPQVQLWVRLRDAAGQRHRLSVGTVDFRFYGWLQKRLRDDPVGDPRHLFWGGPADGVVHHPATLEAIEVLNGTQPEPRTIYLESISFYRDDTPLPKFQPELIEGLPFPTTPDTILPTVEQPTAVSLTRDGDTWVFTAEGDERIVYRYAPQTGTLSDLTAQVAGRPAFTPCAGAGPVLLLGGKEREPTSPEVARGLVSAQREGRGVLTRWRATCEGDSTEYALALRAKGKSLIVDWASEESKTTALRLGSAEGLEGPRIFRVPYLTIYNQGPHVLLDGETFCLTLLDWYHTESSGFNVASGVTETTATINGGSYYGVLTDGTRNPLGERQFINLSSRFEEVLPNIPNPPSTQRAVTRTHLYNHLGGISKDRFDLWLDAWRQYKRRGIEKVFVTHHEDAWSDGADVGQGPQEYTFCTEAAPEVGDEKMQAYCKAMRDMGYYIGLYENFTDYNPLGRSWDERNAARNSAGELMRVWPPTYAIRPLKALELALYYPREVARKFGTNTAYRDCHTAYPPWGQVDFQAGSPGAGKFATNFRAWGALLLDGHKAYDGPIFSEGTHHWFSAGLVDGNYAQMGVPNATEQPLFVDFDLRKIHPLEADIAMQPHWSWGGDTWRGLATTIAYGHIGFQTVDSLTDAGRYYYLIQQLQTRYVMEPVESVLYHVDGELLPITEVLKRGLNGTNQVLVTYRNGLEVAVNCDPEQRWQVEVGGVLRDLSPYGWATAMGDEFEEWSTVTDGVRQSYVRSPEYTFVDGGGRLRSFGDIETDGALALRATEPGARELIVIAPFTEVRFGEPLRSARALDEARRPLDEVALEPAGDQVVLRPVPNAVSYVLGGD
jgi:hypothetical protein